MTQKYKKFLIKTTKTITKLIHSHNTFGVFFSGTDMEELEDNAPCYNFYLSLIVNNALDFEAKIAFIGEGSVNQEIQYKALDNNGEEYVIDTGFIKASQKKLYIYDCDIKSNKSKTKERSFFEKNVSDVLSGGTPVRKTYGYSNNTPKVNRAKPVRRSIDSYKVKSSSWLLPTEDVSDYLEDDLEEMEMFACALFNGGTIEPDKNFEDILEEIEAFKITPQEVATSVMENYYAVFEEFYSHSLGDRSNFAEVTESLIDFLENENNNILITLIVVLKNTLKKFLTKVTVK